MTGHSESCAFQQVAYRRKPRPKHDGGAFVFYLQEGVTPPYAGSSKRGEGGSLRNLMAGPICGLPASSFSSMLRAAAWASAKPAFNDRTGAQQRSMGSRKASHSARVFVLNIRAKNSMS